MTLYSERLKKSLTSHLWIQLLACIGAASLCAQEYPWVNYTVDDGLASNYVYGAIELSNGTVWAFTEKGVARFDGQQFHNYNVEDGLADNDTWKIDRDLKGRGIMSSFGNGISLIVGDSIQKLKASYPNTRGAPVIINGEGYLIDLLSSTAVQIEDSTKVIKARNPKGTESHKLFVEFHANTVIVKNKTDTTDIWYLNLSKLKSDREKSILQGLFFGPSEHHIIIMNSRGWLIANFKTRTFTEKLWSNYGITNEPSFRKDILWRGKDLFLFLPNGCIHIDSLGNEVEVIDIGNIKEEVEALRVLPDEKGNIWLGTQGNGLYFLPKHNRINRNILKLHPKSNGIEQLLPTESGNVLALPDDGYPIVIQPDYKIAELKNIQLRNFIDIIELNNNKFLLTNSNPINSNNNYYTFSSFLNAHKTVINNTKSIQFNSEQLYAYKKTAFDSHSDVVLFSVNWVKEKNLYAMKSSGDTLTIWDYELTLKCFAKASDGGVWIATSSGIFKHFNNQIKPIFEHPALQQSVSFYQNKESLFFSTQDDDIYSLNLDDKEFKKLANLKSINRIRKGNKGSILTCTNHGLIRLDDHTGKVIREYKVSSGLSSNQINDVYEMRDEMLVASNVGVDKLPIELEQKIESTFPFKITSFLVNNKVRDFNKGQIKFNNLENNLQLKYTLQDYQSAGDIKYYTKLAPIQSEWQESNVPSVDYWGLAPGDYTFQLKARRYNGQELCYGKAINFTIKPTLFKNPIFYFFAVAIGLGLYIWLTQRKQATALDALKQKNVMNKKISELQLSALRSQMNPHFIFNALGAIQYYIQTKDADMAEDYLSQFAFLMRKYLEASKRPMINLTEEIELLKLYTSIEVMRYSHRFKVELQVDEDLDKFDTMIPSVLIQPFVENSILHGLHSRKSAGGLLNITFNQIGDDLHVIISDNGIGLKKSKKQSNSFHTPTGLINISDRIKTISYSTGMKIDLTYNIPYPENEHYPGHEVVLIFKNTIT